ncbi:MAG: SRPBCC family protein [Marmoricola sp.]
MALHVSNWGELENGPRPRPDPGVSAVVSAMGVSVQMPMACRPEVFRDLITSVERIGEFSPECVEAWWVQGFPARAVGGRFEGRNCMEGEGDTYEWTRPCDVVVYDPPYRFSYTVGDRFDGTAATRWTFQITPVDAGCVVEQQFEHLPDGLSGIRLHAELLGDADAHIAKRRDMLRDGMTQTLDRIRAVVEAGF